MDIFIATTEEAETIDQSIVDFNADKIPYYTNPPWENLHYVLKSKDGALIGGIVSYLMMNNILNVSVIFIDEKHRGKGYGSMLLEKVEQESKKRGAYISQLDTFDFQSGLGFYKKHGYKVFAEIKNNPVMGHIKYYLKKDL